MEGRRGIERAPHVVVQLAPERMLLVVLQRPEQQICRDAAARPEAQDRMILDLLVGGRAESPPAPAVLGHHAFLNVEDVVDDAALEERVQIRLLSKQDRTAVLVAEDVIMGWIGAAHRQHMPIVLDVCGFAQGFSRLSPARPGWKERHCL